MERSIVSRLNTDNADTMPITDALYGKKPRDRKPAKEYTPRDQRTPMWRVVSQDTLNQLARYGKETRRLAARRRQEGT